MKPIMKTEAKERPILFSTEMVKAIVGGRKTQTRRIVKSTKTLGDLVDVFDTKHLAKSGFIEIDTKLYHAAQLRCPYGKVGDLLWVKETYAVIANGYGIWRVYRASDQTEFSNGANSVDEFMKLEGCKWKSPRYMPRIDSRITLEITNIKVERVQDISEEDARREGVQEYQFAYGSKLTKPIIVDGFHVSAQYKFSKLWQQINGEKSWDNNPWVWVIEFKKI
jgi:hypothetical protein